MRLIDADYLLEEIAKLKESPWFNEGKLKIEPMVYSPHVLYTTRKETVEIIEDFCIKKQPTVERPKGKWELYESKVDCYDIAGVKTWGNKYRCCNCGFIHTVIEDFGFYDFCPHCGADMREVEDSLWDKAIKADDIKKDDEWMQDDKWDEIYKEGEQ